MNIDKYNHFSQNITVFHGLKSPSVGDIVGYAAIIDIFLIPWFYFQFVQSRSYQTDPDDHEQIA